MKPKSVYLCLLLSIFLIFTGTESRAEVVSITNPSFEVDVPEDGGWQTGAEGQWIYSHITGWNVTFGGTFRPSSVPYPDGLPDGNNVAFLGSSGTISQTLSETLSENVDYTLTVYIGDRADSSFQAYSIQFLAGGNILSQDNNFHVPENGHFTISKISYSVFPGNPYIGLPLEIRLLNNGNGQVNFDLISLETAQFVPDLSRGVVASYAFKTNADDSSGNEINGIPTGAILVEDRFGIPNSAFKFDGVDDYITVPHVQVLNPTTFSMVAWIKLNSDVNNTQTRILNKQEDLNQSFGLEIFGAGYDGSTGNQLVMHTTDGGNLYKIYSSTNLEKNIWYHVVGAYDGSEMRLYIDGSLSSTQSQVNGQTPDIDAPLVIGKVGPTGSGFEFDGVIDSIIIYDRVLAESEIQTLYKIGSIELINGLIAYYPFEDSLNDVSLNQFHGTENGGINFLSGVLGKAAYFDGLDDYVRVSNFDFNDRSKFSVTLWVKPEIFSGNHQQNFIQKNGDATDVEIIIRTEGDGKYDAEWTIGGQYYDLSSDTIGVGDSIGLVDPSFDTFDFLTLIYDGVDIKFYVNGQLIRTQSASGPIAKSIYPFNFGAYAPGPWALDGLFKGLLDEVRFYNRPLTEVEIWSLYQQNNSLLDSDGDGVPDIGDNCPYDPAKTEPGICGCGVSDIDTDNDGKLDCNDDDDDGDGMPDAYENQYPELDPLINDAHADADGDNFTNIVEYHSGTDPADEQSIPPTNLKDGLVAFYPFNGNANDESGKGNHGTPHSDVALVEDRFGNLDSAYSLDGVDDFIEKLSPSDDLNIKAQGWSVSSWIKSTGDSTHQTILSRYECGWDCSINASALYILKIIDCKISARIRDDEASGPDNDNGYSISGNTDVCGNSWHHVGFVLDRIASTFSIFQNGVLTESISVPAISSITDNGSPFETPIKHMFGKNQWIFEVRFSNLLILQIPNF